MNSIVKKEKNLSFNKVPQNINGVKYTYIYLVSFIEQY